MSFRGAGSTSRQETIFHDDLPVDFAVLRFADGTAGFTVSRPLGREQAA